MYAAVNSCCNVTRAVWSSHPFTSIIVYSYDKNQIIVTIWCERGHATIALIYRCSQSYMIDNVGMKYWRDMGGR